MVWLNIFAQTQKKVVTVYFGTIKAKYFWKRSFWAFKSQNFEKLYKINIKIQAISIQVL